MQNYIETTKIKSIDFFKQYESENKKLVSKVPAINRERYSKKEIMIVVACSVSMFSPFFYFLKKFIMPAIFARTAPINAIKT